MLLAFELIWRIIRHKGFAWYIEELYDSWLHVILELGMQRTQVFASGFVLPTAIDLFSNLSRVERCWGETTSLHSWELSVNAGVVQTREGKADNSWANCWIGIKIQSTPNSEFSSYPKAGDKASSPHGWRSIKYSQLAKVKDEALDIALDVLCKWALFQMQSVSVSVANTLAHIFNSVQNCKNPVILSMLW